MTQLTTESAFSITPVELETQAQVQAAIARANLYRFLSALFETPNAEMPLGLIEHGFFADARGELKKLGASAANERALNELEKRLRANANPEFGYAFTRIFAHAEKVAPLYETEYTTPHIFQQTQEMADIAGFYRAFGMQIATDSGERPDHLGAELEFLSMLALKEALALQEENSDHVEIVRDATAKFLRAHLGRWLGVFAKSLNEMDADGFYAGAAILAREFVAWDAAQAGVTPIPVATPYTPRRVEPESLECGTPNAPALAGGVA